MKRHLVFIVKTLIKKFYFVSGKFTKSNSVLFVPHAGMCTVDYYDIINYKSDSALTFLHYILDNELLRDKCLFVAARDDADFARYNEYVNLHYPGRVVSFFPYFHNKSFSPLVQIGQFVNFCRIVSGCTHIFTSITHDFSGLISSQVVVDLNYFTAAMKNDILDRSNPHYTGIDKAGHEYSYIVGTSEIAIRLTLPEMTLPYGKYKNFGLCRNDNVLNGDSCEWLRNEIKEKVSYKINKIVLYTPTHRDYESAMTGADVRSILGFAYNPTGFGQFLKEMGIVFVCKLHPKQNALIIERDLPEGIILHKPNQRYGLTELMQASDALVTDYTSVYFDYLLLDKPIIFNFYDLNIYKRERGVPCEPMSAISAGEIVENEEQMKKALSEIDINQREYSQMRRFVRNLFFTDQDTDSCHRVYDFIFVSNSGSR